MVLGMDTDARETARRYYSRSCRSCEADLAALLSNPAAFVCWAPRLVVLAKPVLLRRPAEWERLEHSPAAADAWYVHLLAGDVSRARRLACDLPPLRWLCFQRGSRNERLHAFRWRRILLH